MEQQADDGDGKGKDSLRVDEKAEKDPLKEYENIRETARRDDRHKRPENAMEEDKQKKRKKGHQSDGQKYER